MHHAHRPATLQAYVRQGAVGAWMERSGVVPGIVTGRIGGQPHRLEQHTFLPSLRAALGDPLGDHGTAHRAVGAAPCTAGVTRRVFYIHASRGVKGASAPSSKHPFLLRW